METIVIKKDKKLLINTIEGREFLQGILIEEECKEMPTIDIEEEYKKNVETLHQSMKVINIEIHPNTLAKVVKMYDIIKVKGGAITLQEIFKLK